MYCIYGIQESMFQDLFQINQLKFKMLVAFFSINQSKIIKIYSFAIAKSKNIV